MQRIYLPAEKYATILCLAACLATDTHTHTHLELQPGVGTRSDCVDGNALIRLWQSIMQLTWLGAAAAKNG